MFPGWGVSGRPEPGLSSLKHKQVPIADGKTGYRVNCQRQRWRKKKRAWQPAKPSRDPEFEA